MPLSFAFIFRALVLVLLALHVFYMYCTARGEAHTFGFHEGPTVIACLFALVMLLPFVWAVFLPELPEYIDTVVRPRRKWRKGQCPHCGYDRISLPRGTVHCPECGGELIEPEPMRWLNLRTVKRFAVINLAAWVVGCFAGELWMQDDERHFRQEAAHHLATQKYGDYTRPRRWPTQNKKLLLVGPWPPNMTGAVVLPGDAQISWRDLAHKE